MTRRTRLFATLLSLAAAPAAACGPHGCGGGFAGGYSGGYYPAQPAYYAPQPSYYPPQQDYYPPQPIPTNYASVSARTVAANAVAAATRRAQAATQQAQAVAAQATALAQVRALVAQAKTAFAAKNYGTALDAINKVVAQAPKDSEALEFRSLIRFAMADYTPAAADAYESMKLGPVWNAAALKMLYGDMATYERHFKELESAAADKPQSLDVHFLLAQHLLMKGDLAAGEKELEAVTKIRPDEPLAAKLLANVRDIRSKETKQVASDTP